MAGIPPDGHRVEPSIAAPDIRAGLLEAVVAAAPIGVAIVERTTGRIVYFNEPLCDIWGLQPLRERMARGEVLQDDLVAHLAVRAKDAAGFATALRRLQE